MLCFSFAALATAVLTVISTSHIEPPAPGESSPVVLRPNEPAPVAPVPAAVGEPTLEPAAAPPTLPPPVLPPQPATEALPSTPLESSQQPEPTPQHSSVGPLPHHATAWPTNAVAPGDDPSTEDSDAGLLAPAEHRKLFLMSVGRSARIGYGSYLAYDNAVDGPAMIWELAVGARGRARAGKKRRIGGAFLVRQAFGYRSRVEFGGRLRLERSLSKTAALHSVTNVDLGIRPLSMAGGYFSLIPAGTLGASWGVEAIVADRLVIGIRPVSVAVAAPVPADLPVELNFESTIGVGTVW